MNEPETVEEEVRAWTRPLGGRARWVPTVETIVSMTSRQRRTYVVPLSLVAMAAVLGCVAMAAPWQVYPVIAVVFLTAAIAGTALGSRHQR